jgi:hypothetical protein
MTGSVLDISKRGLCLLLPEPVPAGTPIKIDSQDALILGEVSYCAPQNDAFRVGLMVKHRLAGLAELHRLNQALHQTAFGAQVEEASSIIEK